MKTTRIRFDGFDGRPAGTAMLVVGVLLLVLASAWLMTAHQRLSHARGALADVSRQPAAREASRPSARRIAASAEVTSATSHPWEALFLAVERARLDEVRLLGIEAEVRTRQFRITLESDDVASAQRFAGSLAGPLLHGVQIESHAPVRGRDGIRALVVGYWAGERG